MAKSSLSNLVRNVQFNVTGFSEIKKDLEALVKGKKQLLEQALAEGRATKKQIKEYEQLQKQLEGYEKEMNLVRKTIDDLGSASPRKVAQLNAAFKRMSTTIGSMSAEARAKIEQLLGKVAPVTEAMAAEFKKGFTDMTKGLNLNTATFSQLQNFVQTFVKEGRDLALVAEDDAKAYAKMGENATNAMIQMGKMDGTLVALQRDASPERIAEYIAGWKRVAEFSGATAQQIREAEAAMRMARGQQKNQDLNVVNNAERFSPKEVQDATKRLQEYLDTEKNLAKSVRQDLTEAVKKGNEELKKMAQTDQMSHYNKQFQQLAKLSTNALAEQKKWWTEMAAGAEKGSAEEDKYLVKLRQVEEQERRNAAVVAETNGKRALRAVQGNAYSKTTSEIERQIEVLKRWRAVLEQQGATDQVDKVDAAVRQLNRDLVESQESVRMANKYIAATASGKPFEGTVQDLQKVRQGLVEMRDKMRKIGDAKQIRDLDNQILKVDQDIRTAGMTAERFNAIVSNPKKANASLKELQMAYEKLKLQIQETGRSQSDYQKIAMQMSSVKKQMDALNGSALKQKSIFSGLITNVKNIVLHYVGLQMIFMRLINTLKDVVKLSDLMTNVQKVTNMTTLEVRQLTKSLQDMDTRASTENLLKFAEQAGKLGIYTQRGIAGVQQFVEIGEMISRTLGEEMGGAESVAGLAKLNNVLGVTDTVLEETHNKLTVMKDALNATGSAILNVGNNSAASYGNIVNFLTRVGATSAQAQLSVPQITALAGTLDAVGISAENGSTALSQFISAVLRKTDEIARAGKVDVETFHDLVHGFTDELGNTVAPDMMAALQMLFESLREGRASAQDLMDAMSGRSRSSVQIRNMLNTYAQHTKDLGDQLEYATQGFDSALGGVKRLSVLEREFERVNNNTAGAFERFENKVKEVFVNPTTEQWANRLGDALLWQATQWDKVIYYLGVWTEKTDNAIKKVEEFGDSTTSVFAEMYNSLEKLGVFGRNLQDLIDKMLDLSARMIGNVIPVWAKFYTMILTTNEVAAKMSSIIHDSEAAMRDQTREASNLFSMLQRLNSSEKEKKMIMNEINNRYGTMLGFMINEKSTALEIANAYSLVVDKIKEKMRMQAREQAMERATKASNEGINNAVDRINSGLESRFGEDRPELASRYSVYLQRFVEEIVNSDKNNKMSEQEVYDKVMKRTAKQFSLSVETLTNGLGNTVTNATKQLIKATQSRNRAEEVASRSIQASAMAEESAAESNRNQRRGIVTTKLNKFASQYKNNRQALTIEDLDDMLNSLNSILNDESMLNVKKGSQQEKNIKAYRKWVSEINDEKARRNPYLYGTANTDLAISNLANWDDDQIVQAHAQANTAKEMNKDGVMWSRMRLDMIPGLVDKMPMKAASAVIDKFDEALKAEAEKRHITLSTGDLHHPAEKTSKAPKFDESDGAIAELDRYYSEREETIRMNREKELITEAEMNRQILLNEEEHLERRNKLRLTFTSKDKEMVAQFDAWWKSVEELDKLERGKIAAEWAEADDKAIKTNNKKAQQDLTAREKMIVEHIRKLNDIIRKDGAFNKIASEFQDSLDELELLVLDKEVGDSPEHLKSIIQRRMGFVLSMVGEAYSMTMDELQRRLDAIDWKLDDKQVEMLMTRLQTFADTYEQTMRSAANSIKKVVDMQWKSSGQEEYWAKRQKEQETSNKLNDQYRGVWGGETLDGRTISTDGELEMYRLRIEASKQYMEQLKEEMDMRIAKARAEEGLRLMQGEDASEARAEVKRLIEERDFLLASSQENINSLTEDFVNKQNELSLGLVNNLKPYAEMMEQFAFDFGQNVFGSKEDRENAARALLETFVKTTNTMLTQYLIYLATKKMADKAALIEEITDEGTAATAKVAVNGAVGTSKEVAKKGLVGLATSAGITIAMNFLTGMILSQISKSKSMLGATGKVTTNMLTYAEGKYPTYSEGERVGVDANDGKHYNARYTGKVKTGVYHGPHMAVFSEKGDEMIIDHPTLSRIAEYEPWLLRSIQDMHRFGRLTLDYGRMASVAKTLRTSHRGVRTYAEGNVEEVMNGLGGGLATESQGTGQAELVAVLNGVAAALDNLAKNPVSVELFGSKGNLDEQQRKLEGWKEKYGWR